MRFDQLDLPVEDNASDKQDSIRLNALMVVFNYPGAVPMKNYLALRGSKIPLRDDPEKFFVCPKTMYVRHPREYAFDLSRDQYICAIAGFAEEDERYFISREFVNGKDFMSPTVAGHEARCKGQTASWWHDLWLWADMMVQAKFTPLSEPNQLLIMLKTAGDDWIVSYRKANPQWREALRRYWRYTRTHPEKDLCEHIIKEIEKIPEPI